jgi:hypothetical protein
MSPIILAIWEAAIRRIKVSRPAQAQEKKVHETPLSMKKSWV